MRTIEIPKVLGLIPARGGSKGVPNKNFKYLGNMPLIQYTIESALQSRLLHTVAISSDSEKITAIARQFPKLEVPFVRPSHLAADSTPSIEVVQHALLHYKRLGQEFDYVCLLQPTTPFRTDDLIDKTINHFIESQADCLITIRKIPHKYHPSWAFKQTADSYLEKVTGRDMLIPSRQELLDTFYRDGKIYITSTGLIENGFLVGGKIVGFLNENEPDINIDSQADWEAAENQLISNGTGI